MGKPDIITTPSGDRLAILPLADYERLRDAAEDAAEVFAYDRARAALSSGADELVPAAVADRLLSGEQPIRVWREYRGLSARELADAADIAPAYLSQIETGKRDGSFETIKRIAAALRIDIDDLA